jgi:hypothetical protein
MADVAETDAAGRVDGAGEGRGTGEKKDQEKGKKLKVGKGVIAVIAGVLAAAASLATILAYLQSQHSGPPSFDADLTTSASQFASFLSGADGKIAYIHIQCGQGTDNGKWYGSQDSKCFSMPAGKDAYLFILSLGSFSAPQYMEEAAGSNRDAQTAWVTVVLTPNTGVLAYNGTKGAGWLEVQGYFQVTSAYLGNGPPKAKDYLLRAVSPTFTTQ